MGGILPCGCLVLNWMLLKRRTGNGERGTGSGSVDQGTWKGEQGAGNGNGERETENGERGTGRRETTTPKLCALLLYKI